MSNNFFFLNVLLLLIVLFIGNVKVVTVSKGLVPNNCRSDLSSPFQSGVYFYPVCDPVHVYSLSLSPSIRWPKYLRIHEPLPQSGTSYGNTHPEKEDILETLGHPNSVYYLPVVPFLNQRNKIFVLVSLWLSYLWLDFIPCSQGLTFLTSLRS